MTTLIASPRAYGRGLQVTALMTLLVAGAVRADPVLPAAPEPATTYRLSARVRLNREALTTSYEHDPRLPGAPPNVAVSVEVGAQAREAYAAAASRMFRPEPALETVEIEVAIVAAELDRSAGWWNARVEHAVVLRAADGTDVVRWPIMGEARLPGYEAQDVPRAFARAAAAAAERFEKELDASGAMRQFLAARGLAPRVVPAPPAVLAPPIRDRGRLVGFLDIGTGVSVGTSEAIGLAARGGVSTRWFLAQLTLDAWRGTFEANPAFGRPTDVAALDAISAGIDVLAVLRFLRRYEVRAGVGAQFCWGKAKQRYAIEGLGGDVVGSDIVINASGGVASLLGSITYAPDMRWIPRLTLEVRRALGEPLGFDVLRTELAPAETSFMVLFGLERSIW